MNEMHVTETFYLKYFRSKQQLNFQTAAKDATFKTHIRMLEVFLFFWGKNAKAEEECGSISGESNRSLLRFQNIVSKNDDANIK